MTNKFCAQCPAQLTTKWERQMGLCNCCQAERDGLKGTEQEPEFEFRSLPPSVLEEEGWS